MSTVAALCQRPVAWLSSPGAHDGVIISTRVRLARNSAAHPFPRKLERRQQQELVDLFIDRLSAATAWKNPLVFTMRSLDENERQVLAERQLISRDLASGKRAAALLAAADESTALMINEEDHLRLQVFSAGFDLNGCLRRAVAIDRACESQLSWAVHPRHGYLTSCPTNAGTGMRASVMLHLPALADTEHLRQVLRGLAKLNMTVRGLHGEGSEASGHFYQISNQRSLGHDESTLVGQISEAVMRIVEHERLARETLLSRNRLHLEDRVWRGWALLTHARKLAYDELIEQLSWVRLGVAAGLLPLRQWSVLDRILVQCQPAHLQATQAGAEVAEARDHLRAEQVRTWLAAAV